MSENNKPIFEINFNELLKSAVGLPGVKISRTSFLTSALKPYFSEDIVQKAVANNPASAGISIDEISKIADESIKFETRNVTLISTAAGIPGGLAIIGTIPADLAQYFGHILRILQKLIYLYGWDELFDENGDMDDSTANILTLFTGVMFGVNGAAAAINKIADQAARHTAKALANKALTKGIIYPIVKKIATALGVKMTKDIFAKGVSKIIPFIGGIASGGITYITYKPMAIKLRDHLSTLKFADTEFYKDKEQETIFTNNFSEVN